MSDIGTITDVELIVDARKYSLNDGAYTGLSLIRELATALAAHQWQPIDTAPRYGTYILLGAPGYIPETGCWDESPWLNGWYCGGNGSDSYGPAYSPTHWMPVPAPPETKP